MIKQGETGPSEDAIAQVSEIALQDIFGLLAEWDEEANGSPLRNSHTLRWLYGLLCLL